METNNNHKSISILVVDDEPLLEYVIQQNFRKQIKNKQFVFYFAENGVQALEKLNSGIDVDMVLTDLNMPEMDGLTLLEKLSTFEEKIKSVVVSAYGDVDNIRKAMNLGAFDFLIKPINLEDLKITVNKTLKHLNMIKLKQQKLEFAQEQLEYLAYHDSLTNLGNRALFMQQLERVIEIKSKNVEYQYAILFLDLDKFKVINDTLGHIVGDRLLQQFAHRLKTCLNGEGIIARLGGDEFAILIENIKNREDAIKLAEKIAQKLEKPFNLDEYPFYNQASIGITYCSNGYAKPEEILRDADIAMYRAKKKPEVTYEVFDNTMQSEIVERLNIENGLRQALANAHLINECQPTLSLETRDIKGFEVLLRSQKKELREALGSCYILNYYQPIVSLQTRKIQGFEVLLRSRQPERGLISPALFIPVAEETRLINPIGLWLFQEACRQLQYWSKEFPNLPLFLSINVSPVQLKQRDFVPQIQEIIASSGLPAHVFKVEITESCLLENLTLQIERLCQLRDMGIGISIDDFGMGYSSLSRLHEFPIDNLKIDRSFIRNMTTNPQQYATVEMIIALANSLDCDITAEGIETEKELKMLLDLDCKLGQGYLFARPLDAQAATELLRANQ